MGYGPEHVQRLEGLEHIRLRPRMYLGCGDLELALVDQALCIFVDAEVSSQARGCRLAVAEDGTWLRIVVPGTAVDPSPRHGRSHLTLLMTEVGACARLRTDPRVAENFCTYGLAITNAFSLAAELGTVVDGIAYYQRFSRGEPVSEVNMEAAAGRQGTWLQFWPDYEALGAGPIRPGPLREHLLAILDCLPECRVETEVVSRRLRPALGDWSQGTGTV